jgi:hypothetical protein
VRLIVGFGFFQRSELTLTEHQAFPERSWPPMLRAAFAWSRVAVWMKAAWMVEVTEVPENGWFSSVPHYYAAQYTHILKGSDASSDLKKQSLAPPSCDLYRALSFGNGTDCRMLG